MFNIKEIMRLFDFSRTSGTKIILFGTGEFAQKVFDDIQKIGISIAYCIDNNRDKWGKSFNNIEIRDPNILTGEDQKNIFVIIASMYYREMAKQLQSWGVINYLNGKELFSIEKLGLKLSPMDVRDLVSKFWLLEGKGIEIGALHAPLALNEGLEIQYVDVVDKNTWKEVHKNKNLTEDDVVDVDVVDDAGNLNHFRDNSLDFIIANHVIEHTPNPIKTLETFMKKLKKKGKVFLCIPDKRYTFDQKRELTSFDHLVKDYKDDGENSKYSHYKDFVSLVEGIEGNEVETKVERMIEDSQSIHFHVWDNNSCIWFLLNTNSFLNNIFEIKHLQQNGNELICILEKL